jgi:biopolymer transport protein ExbD
MAGVDVGGSGNKRSVNSDVNMIPFIDLLMVTISFLLITAVWITHSRIEATAQVPSQSDKPVDPDTPRKDLHVFVKDAEYVLSWKQAGTVVTERHVERTGNVVHDQLGKAIVKEWNNHGGHTDPSDRKRDRCVLHTDNQLPFRDMIAVMDAVSEAKREVNLGGEKKRVPAFDMALASR